MNVSKLYTAIGLMSGTSVDGIDAALIETDGHAFSRALGAATLPYDHDLRMAIHDRFGARNDPDGKIAGLEKDITLAQADCVRELLSETGKKPEEIDVIGFHGQTITHDPENRFTWQLGDGAMMARETGIDVVSNMRKADMLAGGQGAPMLPLYHEVLVRSAEIELPAVVLNIGGVANMTWIGKTGIMGFDAGPGNALLDDFVVRRTDARFDRGGALAASGRIHQDYLLEWLSHPFFDRAPPKSLDRNAFDVSDVRALSDSDGARTLAAFTAYAVKKAFDHLPEEPLRLIVTGGGRHNPVIMRELDELLGVPVEKVEDYGWNGDVEEAEGFAYLAVRSLLGLPLSLPETTGVPEPVTGGVFHKH